MQQLKNYKPSTSVSTKMLEAALKDASAKSAHFPTYEAQLKSGQPGNLLRLRHLVSTLTSLNDNWTKFNPSLETTQFLICYITQEVTAGLQQFKSYSPEALAAQELVSELFSQIQNFYDRNVFKWPYNLNLDKLLEAIAALKPPKLDKKEKKILHTTQFCGFNISNILDLVRHLNRVKVIEPSQLGLILAAAGNLATERRVIAGKLKIDFILDYYTAPTTKPNLEELNNLLQGLLAFANVPSFQNYPSNKTINLIVEKIAGLPAPELIKNQSLVLGVLDSICLLIRGCKLNQDLALAMKPWCTILDKYMQLEKSSAHVNFLKQEVSLAATTASLPIIVLLDYIDCVHRFANMSSKLESSQLLAAVASTTDQLRKDYEIEKEPAQKIALNIAELLFTIGKLVRSNQRHYREVGKKINEQAIDLLKILGTIIAKESSEDKKHQQTELSLLQLKNIIFALHGMALLANSSSPEEDKNFTLSRDIDKVLAKTVIANLELILAQRNAHKLLNMFLFYTYAHGISLSPKTIMACQTKCSEEQAKDLAQRVETLLESHKPIAKPFQEELAVALAQKTKHEILVEYRLRNSPFCVDLYDNSSSSKSIVELDGSIHEYSREKQENVYRDNLIKFSNARAGMDIPIIHVPTNTNLTTEQGVQKILKQVNDYKPITKKQIEQRSQLLLFEYFAQPSKPEPSTEKESIDLKKNTCSGDLSEEKLAITAKQIESFKKIDGNIPSVTTAQSPKDVLAEESVGKSVTKHKKNPVKKLPNPSPFNRKTRQRQKQKEKEKKQLAKTVDDSSTLKQKEPAVIPVLATEPPKQEAHATEFASVRVPAARLPDEIKPTQRSLYDNFQLPLADVNLLLWLAEQGEVDAQYQLGYRLMYGDGTPRDTKQAIYWLQRAAEQGNASAQTFLGICYFEAIGVAKDVDKAAALFLLNSTENELARTLLARCYQDGSGIEKDTAKAFEYFRQGAEQGRAIDQYHLGRSYLLGIGVEKNPGEARHWFESAAAQGFLGGYLELARCYKNGTGTKIEITKAIANYELAAKMDCSDALIDLAFIYRIGTGDVPIDEKKAFTLIKQAAAIKDAAPKCHFFLGDCYEYGIGIEKDVKRAKIAYKLAATRGDSAAQVALGRFYEEGISCDPDAKEALRLYKAAAEQNDPDGKVRLGDCYQRGIGVSLPNPKKAVQLFQEAIELNNNHAEAHEKLGFCYGEGLGVEPNHPKAIEHLQLAIKSKERYIAYSLLGQYYEDGDYLTKDLKKAFMFYKIAADGGLKIAKGKLARCYELGIGVDKDPVLAQQLNKEAGKSYQLLNIVERLKDKKLAPSSDMLRALKSAVTSIPDEVIAGLSLIEKTDSKEKLTLEKMRKMAADGDPNAMVALAKCHILGKLGLTKNLEMGLQLFTQAGALAEGFYFVAECYSNGEGMDRDRKIAIEYYKKASSLGNEKAKVKLETLLKDQLTARYHSGSPVISRSSSTAVTTPAEIGVPFIPRKFEAS